MRDWKMLRIVIFDDEERIGLQLKELLEQSGDDLVVDFSGLACPAILFFAAYTY